MNPLDAINAAVTKIEGTSASLIEHDRLLGVYIKDHIGDTAALTALSERLQATGDKEVAAVIANPLPGENVVASKNK